MGIKQYGYWYLNSKGERIVKTVFAGVTRDSLTFEQIVSMLNGAEITVQNKDRFFKSLNKLTIQIKSTQTIIKQNTNKKLVNNEYLPIHIYYGVEVDNLFINLLVSVLKSYTLLVKNLKQSFK